MLIKLRTTAAGPHFRGSAGETIDVHDEVGRGLIAANAAEQADHMSQSVERTIERKRATSHKAESATLEAPEKAVKPKPGRRKGGGKTKHVRKG
ncbi:hypothetical protein LCGC14_1234870 [marine sediment metagenome]|uniref:Uncharacterized protein n=1 Tax=marine sediment metagenome TaxID=412755 RepID=A0A0F9NPQ8_9ZZZZ